MQDDEIYRIIRMPGKTNINDTSKHSNLRYCHETDQRVTTPTRPNPGRVLHPSGLEDRMWVDSLLMMRSLVRYLEQEVDDREKHVSLQLTFLHIVDPLHLGGVTVSAWNGQYKIEYTIPPHKAPWKHAKVVGHASDIFKAVEMLYLALSASDQLSREYASFFE